MGVYQEQDSIPLQPADFRQGGKMMWLSATKGGTNERLQTKGNKRYQ